MDHDDAAANGNQYLSFAQLMRLDKVGDGAFKSTAKAFSPGGTTAAYGGHVYAQAVWAASQTVRRGFVVSNVTGFFILPGDTTRPFVYHVRTTRDGGRYCTRSVDVFQEPQGGICFTCTCMFKVDEQSDYDCQDPYDLPRRYRSALGDRRPEDWPEAPSVDSPWYWEMQAANNGTNHAFPGLSLRKVDMEPFNQDRGPLERRQLQFYSTTGDMAAVGEEHNLHACAHLYACDRNSLFMIPNHLGAGDGYTQMASLSYTVVLHVTSQELATQVNGKKRWFCQEARISRAGGNRGLHESRIWGEDGRHIATTMQDGLVRIGSPSKWAAKMGSARKAKM
ncbi:thioesterase-like superfamily-domain-containing protein [Phyllosticta citribraziliensis]|uniref:Thioesterase-like superfamily-domain-containing protein n=1 Tax=Phyllosticta citribraziliensis TaxID=989973 RepID=A0ABR1L407_9PEZI